MKDGKYVVDVVNGQAASQPVPYEPNVVVQGFTVPTIVQWVVTLFILGILLKMTLVIVKQQSVKIIERFGKFKKIMRPGLNFKFPLIDWKAGELDLKIQQLFVTVETKTKDNVFVKVPVAVQYFVIPDKSEAAFYKLDNPEKQITSYVFDVVRSQVPKMVLDDVFEKKEEIAIAVKSELSQIMDDFGYGIVTALVTDIDPNEMVKESMNKINAAQRLRVAATEQGEAEKILIVKKAEADAESQKLHGIGMANQRKAIIEGFKESVESFTQIKGTHTDDVMNLVLMTSYFDTIKNMNASKTIFLPGSPGGINELSSEIRKSIMSANEVK